jgi:hypothetical protein
MISMTTTMMIVRRRVEASRQRGKAHRNFLEVDRDQNVWLWRLFLKEEGSWQWRLKPPGVGADNNEDNNDNNNHNDDNNDDNDNDNNNDNNNNNGGWRDKCNCIQADGGVGGRLPLGNNCRNVLPPLMPMFAVKVAACETLREELRMIGRERRGRMFVERPANFGDCNHDLDCDHGSGSNLLGDNWDGDVEGDSNDRYTCSLVSGLRRKLHEFFRRLKRSTYLLSASLPAFDNDRNILWGDEDEVALSWGGRTWRLKTDDDVWCAFARTEEFFLERCRLACHLCRVIQWCLGFRF